MISASHFSPCIQAKILLGNHTNIVNNSTRHSDKVGLEISYSQGKLCSFTNHGINIPSHNRDIGIELGDSDMSGPVLFYQSNGGGLTLRQNLTENTVIDENIVNAIGYGPSIPIRLVISRKSTIEALPTAPDQILFYDTDTSTIQFSTLNNDFRTVNAVNSVFPA
jgi:hypothetical protein